MVFWRSAVCSQSSMSADVLHNYAFRQWWEGANGDMFLKMKWKHCAPCAVNVPSLWPGRWEIFSPCCVMRTYMSTHPDRAFSLLGPPQSCLHESSWIEEIKCQMWLQMNSCYLVLQLPVWLLRHPCSVALVTTTLHRICFMFGKPWRVEFKLTP